MTFEGIWEVADELAQKELDQVSVDALKWQYKEDKRTKHILEMLEMEQTSLNKE